MMFKLVLVTCVCVCGFFYPDRSLNAELFSRAKVSVGSDLLFTEKYLSLVKGKRVGLVTNHTAVNGKMKSTVNLIKENSEKYGITLVALFAPEHGINGSAHASTSIDHAMDMDHIPIYSLHGETRRPTSAMLQNIEVVVFDIQDLGSRSYTYCTTLFYVMEEAVKYNLPVVVLDRPNPINGLVVDGPMLDDKWRSMVGYINVPYCHGMTIGELARYFNEEYAIGCRLEVVPMAGWKRTMSFTDTGLFWVPSSPYIPEPTTALFYPMTGNLGDMGFVNIGIGYSLPFKVVGAPWIQAECFAAALNKQRFPGVYFQPFHFRPTQGKYSDDECHGVLIIVTNPLVYKPVTTGYLILGVLKSLYPEPFKEAISNIQARSKKEMFCKINGSEEVHRIVTQQKNIVWELRRFQQKERDDFMLKRQKYLNPQYSDTQTVLKKPVFL